MERPPGPHQRVPPVHQPGRPRQGPGPAARTFRDRFSRPVSIHMIGVWDTVGALGIPGTQISEKGRYAWHDTQLSGIVRHACQAMALDEHRSPYDMVLWTHPTGRKKFSQIDVEQRWFTGAHANVGGGYGDDPLSQWTLPCGSGGTRTRLTGPEPW